MKRYGIACGARRAILQGLLVLGLSVGVVFASDRTLYVDRMGGLGTHVQEALQKHELPLVFVAEDEAPEMKAWLKRMMPSAHAEMLYRQKLGRTEDRVLELVDSKNGEVLVRYAFRMDTTDRGLKMIASEFAERVKKTLGKM